MFENVDYYVLYNGNPSLPLSNPQLPLKAPSNPKKNSANSCWGRQVQFFGTKVIKKSCLERGET